MRIDRNVSAEVPDWTRERVRRYWDPGYKLLRSIRRYQAAKERGGLFGKLVSKYWVLNHRLWSTVTQCEIQLHTHIEGGLRLPHPTGVVVHCDARLGPNCQLMQQVTLAGPVTLGGHVDVGAGARILNGVTIGDHAEIGANAVVTKDVPPHAVMVGIPARQIGERHI